MSWKDDRDTLIAQTMAFVQSVANRRPSSPGIAAKLAMSPESRDREPAPSETTAFAPAKLFEPIKVAEAPPEIAAPIPAPHPVAPGEVANEIRARIAGFRAHQERFNREREEYFSKTLAKLRATLDEMPRPPSDK